MTTRYPLDFDTPDDLPSDRTDETPSAETHARDHNNLADAVRAIEGELGVSPSGAAATVADRLTATEEQPITGIIVAGPLDAAAALAAAAGYPMGTVVYEADNPADPSTIYDRWVIADV